MLIIYCLTNKCVEFSNISIPGIDKQKLEVISDEKITAVVSRIENHILKQPLTEHLLEYQKVIEFFHKTNTLIPMRFGETFQSHSDILHFLKHNGKKYTSILNDISGCSEMGINVIAESLNETIKDKRQKKGNTDNDEYRIKNKSELSGKNYLMNRKSYYDQTDHAEKTILDVEKKIMNHMEGIFIKKKKEIKNNQLYAYYFLVKKDKINLFCQKFKTITNENNIKYMLTGPWPPYNFVV
ncbi:Gas vesicle protein GvpL/GvpF [Candidatus Magnetomorum sp. HK-1]|nr:Gas vesicle protein GvpL/GvpF [Candidatus Magnetomorum sp. HK-1]